MYSCVTAGALLGLTCYLVRVEVDIAPGLPVFNVVGMADTPSKESRERVRVALHSLGIRMPASRITVSFSPADIPKRGFVPDLPVAIGILICLGQLRQEDLEDTLISGELGLSGEVRTVRRGMMLLAETAAKEGIRTIIVPEENTAEGAIAADGTLTAARDGIADKIIIASRNNSARGIFNANRASSANDGSVDEAFTTNKEKNAEGVLHAAGEVQSASKKKEQRLKVIGVRNLEDCIRYLKTEREQRDTVIAPAVSRLKERIRDDMETGPDFSDVHGQREAKRALEIAAAGFHNILMIGPPGAGKSMLASRLPGILPPLSEAESMEVTEIYSAAGLLDRKDPLITRRPFLAPHHTVTGVALTGGGEYPMPGLISQAHRGVLFLDELPEFRRDTVNLLRQPMEERQIRIVRRSGTYTYPARFMLCAAANPCPCGFWPDRSRCRCSEKDVVRYQNRIPGPLLDRIDLCITLRQVEVEELTGGASEESSREIRERVMRAVARQQERFQMSKDCRQDEAYLQAAERNLEELQLQATGRKLEEDQLKSEELIRENIQLQAAKGNLAKGQLQAADLTQEELQLLAAGQIASSDSGRNSVPDTGSESRREGTPSGRSRTHFNGDMLPAEVEKYCALGKQERLFAENLFRRLKMSARGFHRLLKVARTIADLEGEERILVPHLAEAAAYRFRFDAVEML